MSEYAGRKNGLVEQMQRIDSFSIDENSELWCGNVILPVYVDNDFCILFPFSNNEIEIRLSHKPNTFGGSQQFFICPVCGERVRFLYFTERLFQCRLCADLIYHSQRATKNDMTDYEKAMRLCVEKLNVDHWPNGFDFATYIPPKPKYMHITKYKKYLKRFSRYQQRYVSRLVCDLMRFSKFGGNK